MSRLTAFPAAASILLLIALSMFARAPGAEAAFHCMRIWAVGGGALGTADIQYVELRMQGGNNLVAGKQLKFYDAGGTLTTTFTFPSSPSNGSDGASILVATSEFVSNATVAPDFVFSAANTDPDNLHPVSAAGGKVQFTGGFDCTFSGSSIIDSVAWGSIASADAGFGTKAEPGGLPVTGTSALTLNSLCFPNQVGCTRDNSQDYSLQTAAPRNNAGVSGSIGAPPGPDADADGVTDASDNCPNWFNPAQTLPNWSVPPGDPDCDGFTTTAENFMGTQPTVHCATTASANDEAAPDAWPMDNNDDQKAALGDILAYIPMFGSMAPNAPYNARFDLNTDSKINLSDILMFIPFFAKACA